MTGVRINSKEENQRQYAVIDQMLTMHSLLRDRMERRAFWLNTALVGSALFLAVFSFIGDEFLRKLGLNPDWTRFVLGLAGVVALICSITEYRVDWRTISGKHADAAARLGALKVTFRKSFSETLGNDDVKNAELSDNYEQTVNSLPTIPDRWFNSLKAEIFPV